MVLYAWVRVAAYATFIAAAALQIGFIVAFLLVPQQRELATRIYDAAANALGWRTPGAQVRASAYGLVVARELGDHSAVTALAAAAEREAEPRFFGVRDERFGFRGAQGRLQGGAPGRTLAG